MQLRCTSMYDIGDESPREVWNCGRHDRNSARGYFIVRIRIRINQTLGYRYQRPSITPTGIKAAWGSTRRAPDRVSIEMPWLGGTSLAEACRSNRSRHFVVRSLPPKSQSSCFHGGFHVASERTCSYVQRQQAATGHNQGHDDGRMPSAGETRMGFDTCQPERSFSLEEMEARMEARKRSRCAAKPDGKHKGFFHRP